MGSVEQGWDTGNALMPGPESGSRPEGSQQASPNQRSPWWGCCPYSVWHHVTSLSPHPGSALPPRGGTCISERYTLPFSCLRIC